MTDEQISTVPPSRASRSPRHREPYRMPHWLINTIIVGLLLVMLPTLVPWALDHFMGQKGKAAVHAVAHFVDPAEPPVSMTQAEAIGAVQFEWTATIASREYQATASLHHHAGLFGWWRTDSSLPMWGTADLVLDMRKIDYGKVSVYGPANAVTINVPKSIVHINVHSIGDFKEGCDAWWTKGIDLVGGTVLQCHGPATSALFQDGINQMLSIAQKDQTLLLTGAYDLRAGITANECLKAQSLGAPTPQVYVLAPGETIATVPPISCQEAVAFVVGRAYQLPTSVSPGLVPAPGPSS